jgi:hypothetical protein
MTGKVYSSLECALGLYATSHFAVALMLIDCYTYRYFAAEVTTPLILGSVLPYASFSALLLKRDNEPHTDKPIKQPSPLSPITIHVGLALRPFYTILL